MGKGNNIEKIYSLTPMQEGMLYHKQLDEQSTGYVLQARIHITGKLKIEKVKESLVLLAEKYDVLRTVIVFSKKSNKPLQVVLNDRKIECNVIELPDSTEKENEIVNIQRADIRRGFNLYKDSLLRVTVLRKLEEEYVLLWSSHHIIIDGWCMSLLFRDFMQYYEALAEGSSFSSMQERVQEEKKDIASYDEYIRWLKKKDMEEGLSYWENLLADYNEAADIPSLSPSRNFEEQVEEEVYAIDKELTRRLQKLSGSINVTMSTVVETAWGILLQKYNRNTDVVFGKVVSGRNADIQGIEKAVGLFINTIPTRVKCEESTTVEEMLGQMQQQAITSMKYDYCPLAEVQGRSALGSNLIRTLFAFENYYIDESVNQGIRGFNINMESSRGQTNYGISLNAFIREELALKIMYDPMEYGIEEIRTLLGRMELLLQQIVADPGKKISELSVVGEEEENLILKTFNYTAVEYPSGKTVVELFEEQVSKTPNNIAVVYEEEEMTYAELNSKANQMAYKLRELGVKPDDKVAIITQRSIEMIIGIYGIIKAGGAYVPMDSDYPEERIKYMLEDCQPKAILVGKAKLPVETNIPVIDLFDREIYTGEIENPEHVNTPNDLIYVIYTSGTTGTPKGVMIEHRALNNYVSYYINNRIAIESFPLYTTISFDLTVTSIYLPLLTGKTIYVYREMDLGSMLPIMEDIFNGKSGAIKITPAHLSIVGNLHIGKTKIKYFIVGGEELKISLAKHISEQINHAVILNEYGPTESTVGCIEFEYKYAEADIGCALIGKPISNIKAYILNHNKEVLPIGIPGELYLGGDSLARGYLNKPELTAARFIDNPFIKGTKIYSTGDLARWLPDGNIEYLGRIDEQVKIRGFRIELCEIESVLRKQTGVRDAAVAVKEKNGDKSICAYVVSDQNIQTSDIKDSLRKELPEYMVPAYILQIENIPVTRNGKLDKRALPEPEAASGQEYIAPRNKTEETIAGIFEEILGVTPVGIEDNFFEMGGHSLRATRVVNQIEAKTGVRLPLKTIFTAPTVKLLAKEVEGAKAKEYIPIPQAEEKEIYPMSSAQKRLYLINQIDDAGITYNMPAGLEIQGRFDFDRMKSALEQLTARHEALRTSFHSEDGEAVQKIAKEVRVELEYEEWTDRKEENLLSGFVRPFDLGKAPLMRAKAVKTAEDKTILMFDMHHIISDGMSISILTKELSMLYNGEQLKPLHVQYKDYSEWMRTRDLSEQKMYWQGVFKEPAPVLDLPLDHLRPQTQSYAGSIINGMLTAKQKKAVDKLCRKTGATAYMVLLSTMMILLGKYSRQEDIVVGSPISGRTHKDTEPMMGMFVNTLAMRGYPKEDKKYLDFLKEVRESALKVYENQEYPFEELVESVEIQRDLSRNPLFDVMFVLQNNEQANLEMNGLKMAGMESEHTIAKFDLTLGMSEAEDGYAMNWEYCTDLFEQGSVERMMKHFSHLVDELTANPEGKISELSMLDEEEKRLVVETFNDTAAEYPSGKTVVELFEEQAKKTPDNIAVVFEEEKMTYRELNEKANQLAYKLRKLGVEPDDKVAILTQRSIEMVIGIYGIIKAGGAYVPIDPDCPEERIRYMLEDCQPKAVLLDKAELPVETDIPLINLFDQTIYTGRAQNPEHVNTPNDLIYIIYTSGTTGKPKGVMIEHGSVINLREYFVKTQGLSETDIILQLSSITFDPSIAEMSMSLLIGGALCLISKECQQDTKLFKEYIMRKHITTILITPLHLAQVDVCGLKTLITGGSEIDRELMLKNVHNCKVYFNDYGPTEATVCSTRWKYINGEMSLPERVPIGKPIANTQIYILNGNDLSGIGMPGELCIAGVGLARGYLNLPELTAEKFVRNPFGKGRMYRTGDLARWLPDGNIEYLGRIDEQVKIRGFRIELGEIESVLKKQTGVRDAAVAVKEKNGDKSICAYVVSDQNIQTSDIKDSLRKELPEYMVPAYILQIENIPVTRNGKLDKRALPEPEAASGQEYIAPRNKTEETIAGIFEEILGVTPVGIEDNFFEMGGHSLRATRVVNQIEAKTGVRLPLKTIFTAPTVKLLAKEVEGAKAKEYIPIPQAEEKEIYPMSSAQKRLYLINQMDDEGITYNMPAGLEIQGRFDFDGMKSALEQLTARHEALRTSFHSEDGEAVQKIAKEVRIELEYEEWTDRKEENLLSGFVRPFNLGKAPLMRMKAVKTGGDKTILLFDMHHIISDGMSISILTKELSMLYNGEQLKPLRVQYKDYSEWMRTRDLSEQKKYWQGVFKEPATVLDLPLDHLRPQTQSYTGSIINGMLTAKQKKAVDKLCRKTGATAYMVLLSTMMILLGKYSRQEDIVVGSPISGRTHKDTEPMMGMFVNTLAMRGYPKEDKKYLDFLKEVRESALKVYENQEYPFEELVESVEIQRDLSRNPLFDVMFVLQNNEQANLEMNGLKMAGMESEHTIAKFDLTLGMSEAEDGYAMNWEYCTDLFEQGSVERMMKHFSHLVDELTANPEGKISELSMLDEEEKRLVVETFNDTAAEYPSGKTVVELFEEQAKKTPDNIAVVFEEEKMTYRELNEKANQLAYKLRKLGVEPDDKVAILTQRSIEMIIGILGIIKAGGAYVPIDPDCPEERIRYMLENSQPKAVLLGKMELPTKTGIPVINLFDKGVYAGETKNPKHVNTPNDLIYIIYTSGTTGKPKGVMIEHAGVVNLREYFIKNHALTASDVVLQFASISFDATVSEMAMSLLFGVRLCLCPEDVQRDTKLFEQYVARHNITIAVLPPQYLTQIDIRHFRTIITAGSETNQELVCTNSKHMKYSNDYGPTEVTVCATHWACNPGEQVPERVPIGKPIVNKQVYIMNGNNLCGIGIPGELCIAGVGLARGYLNLPELTAEKFVENPFGNGRMYCTGDLARWLPDGNIEYLGRIDEQVKIRGFRIELGEIESVLKKQTGVKDAAVAVKEKSGDKSICAYIVSDQEIWAGDIKDSLRKELPEYMVPSYLVQLEKLPLTVNGKIDRKMLPEPDGNIHTGVEYAAPENETEENLIQIWQSVLKVERIGTNDNFFELGGHSLKAIQLLSKLSVDFKVSMNDIFECPTVKSLAGRISYSKGYLKKNIELIKANSISAFELTIAEKGIEYDEIKAALEEYEKKNGTYATIGLSEKQNYKSILLTGSTGYLGIHVLRQLLYSTKCDINLLVHGKNEDEAEQKLVDKLKYYFGDNLYDQYKERINVIKGDLTEDYFGLNTKEYNNLADRVDCVVNSAANVKHYGKFGDFHEINVKGTERLINFCKVGKTKDFNHVSTLSICSGNVKGKRFGVFTEYDIDIGQEYDNYYLATKFEAEKLITNARADGLNCNIFRVGNIVFDSETGKFQENITDNAFYKLIRAGIKLGLMTEMSLQTRDFSCADYVSKAIVLLFDKSNLKNETYHISNPYRVATFELESAAKELGYVVKTVPLDEFLDYLSENVENSTIETYVADMLLHAHVLANSSNVTNFRIESSKTETVLKGIGFEWLQLNHEHICRMLEHCKKVGFI